MMMLMIIIYGAEKDDDDDNDEDNHNDDDSDDDDKNISGLGAPPQIRCAVIQTRLLVSPGLIVFTLQRAVDCVALQKVENNAKHSKKERENGRGK
jgi:hypothetical protein